jgi:hypothetical protein
MQYQFPFKRFQSFSSISSTLPLLLLLLLFETTARAQSTGTVNGNVKDASGATVAGALSRGLTMRRNKKARRFRLPLPPVPIRWLAPGAYTATVSQTGFSQFVRKNVPVDIAATVTIDVALQVGTVSEVLAITGEAPQLQTTESSLSHVVDDTMMDAVPLSSRNFTQVLALSPGVTANLIDAGAIGRNSVNMAVVQSCQMLDNREHGSGGKG